MRLAIIISLVLWTLIGCTSIWVISSDGVTVIDSKELPFGSENDSDTDTVVGGDSDRQIDIISE